MLRIGADVAAGETTAEPATRAGAVRIRAVDEPVAVVVEAVGAEVAALGAEWYSMSSFEGASGFFVVAMALLGGAAGFVIGSIAAWLVARRGKPWFWKSLGLAQAVVVFILLAVAGVARLRADIPPTLDGEVTSYFEWVGAGQLELESAAGSMHRVSPARHSIVTGLRFGFDRSRFYVRVDFSRRASDVLADKGEVELTFLTPADTRLRIRPSAGRVIATVERRLAPGEWQDVPLIPAEAAAGQILELSVDWPALGVQPGGALS